MERSNEIWWLDLKGSPALGGPGMVRQNTAMGRITEQQTRSILTNTPDTTGQTLMLLILVASISEVE